jgi:hypothetical protein
MKRRIFLAATLAVTSSPSVRSRAAGRRTVAVMGDSLAVGLQSGLRQTCRGGAVYGSYGKISSGLVRTAFYDWVNEAGKLASGDCDCGIMLAGLNDLSGLSLKGAWQPLFSVGWMDWYSSRVDAIAAAFAAHSVPLVWVGLPAVRDSGMDAGLRRIDGIFRARAKASGYFYVPIREATGGPGGIYSDYLKDPAGRPYLARNPADGVHFSGAGYNLMAQVVAREMSTHPAVAAFAA